MPFNCAGEISRGAKLPSRPVMDAPIMDRGVMTRFMGRFCIEASPVRVEAKLCPDKIPDMSLMVVPELPQSKICVGVLSE